MNPPPLPPQDKETYSVLPPPELPKDKEPTPAVGKTKSETDRKFPCAECGARMEYDPEAHSLKCPYCGHTDKIPSQKGEKVEEHDYETYLKKLQSQKTGKISEGLIQLRCTGCGAMVTFDKNVISDQCPYCHTHLDKLPTSTEEVILPESVLPFSISNRQAIANFSTWVNSRWFAPNSLKNLANIGQLQGIYLPYFTFDANTYTTYDGQRGVTYTETITNSDGKSQTVTRISWTFVSGAFEHFFDDVLVCASKRLPVDLVNALTPWDLEELTPFTSDYLSGFKTEHYSIELPDSFGIAKQFMENQLVMMVRRDIGGDQQQILHRHSDYKDISFKHLLLPVWMATYRYGDKSYQVLVNGRTGEVQGYRPYSMWKILRLVVIILALIGVVWYFTRAKQGNTGPQRQQQQQTKQKRIGVNDKPFELGSSRLLAASRVFEMSARGLACLEDSTRG